MNYLNLTSSPTSKIQFERTNDFMQTLKARVDRYFRMTGQSPRDVPAMYLKTGIVIAAFVALYLLLVFAAATWWQAVLLSVALGLAVTAVGMNIQHDGGHLAYSNRRWVNRLMAAWMDVIGVSSFVWARKHQLHHTYPNLDGHDDDIYFGPVARLSPQQKRRWYHRLQHIYIWPFYTLGIAKFHIDDFVDLARGTIGEHRLLRPRGWDLVQFIAGKVVFFTLALGLPSLFHPFGSVLGCFLLAYATAGVVSSLVNQLAHLVEETAFPDPDHETGKIETPWAIHQVETAVGWARGNRAISWYVGGLNFQIEHHLFPRVCHVHYPKISRIVEKACRKAGIRYQSFPTLWSALRSHYRWLKEMGSPAGTVAA